MVHALASLILLCCDDPSFAGPTEGEPIVVLTKDEKSPAIQSLKTLT